MNRVEFYIRILGGLPQLVIGQVTQYSVSITGGLHNNSLPVSFLRSRGLVQPVSVPTTYAWPRALQQRKERAPSESILHCPVIGRSHFVALNGVHKNSATSLALDARSSTPGQSSNMIGIRDHLLSKHSILEGKLC
jgi:hypothetical protein